MPLLSAHSRVILGAAALILAFAVDLKADAIAYAGSNTGAFISLDNSGQTLSDMAAADGSLFAASYHTANGALFSVNPSNGSLTSIGSAPGIDFDDFGSTTTGVSML
jgi:hypothetical protein